jgi:uncharacterized radical SAM superfamily Fe-S cluster-containing enzyme
MQKKLLDVRLPLEGHLDHTYRRNNHCRHCWLRISPGDPDRNQELSFDEIRNIVDQARALGTRRWAISGGEPMLRPDFPEIFDYLTGKAVSYTLNTNGALITPEIARLLKRKGTKMVALYGATKETYDNVTRNKRRRGKMTERRKAWVTPELIVLVRSKPEEAVLTACKGGGTGTSFQAQHFGCMFNGCVTYCSNPSIS